MEVGSLGRVRFAKGYYAYVGSARRGMRSRVARHLVREKRKRWYVDWLTTQPGVVPVAVASTTLTGLECRIAATLSSRTDMRVDGFGCSDCECESHLFHFSNADGLFSALNSLRRYGVYMILVSKMLGYILCLTAKDESSKLNARFLNEDFADCSGARAGLPTTNRASPPMFNQVPSVQPHNLSAVSSIDDPSATNAAPSALTIFLIAVDST